MCNLTHLILHVPVSVKRRWSSCSQTFLPKRVSHDFLEIWGTWRGILEVRTFLSPLGVQGFLTLLGLKISVAVGSKKYLF